MGRWVLTDKWVLIQTDMVSGCLAMPSHAASATRPSPMPDPIAPRPEANPAPNNAAHVGEKARAEKSKNSKISEVTSA